MSLGTYGGSERGSSNVRLEGITYGEFYGSTLVEALGTEGAIEIGSSDGF